MVERWEAQDLAGLQSFLDNDHGESHFLEFKQQLPPKNKDIARQLAGFAIDGGSLVIGVAEREPGGFEIALVAHTNLPERVEQIAQASVDPPLFIESRVLKDRDDPSRGVVWITVPPSAEAPHQVDGRYYERGDKQTRPMSDAAVERLMAARRKTIEEIRSKLENLMENDPIPNGTTAHVFGIAEPVGAGPEDLYDAVGGDGDGWRGFCEEARRASRGACRPWHGLVDLASPWDLGPDGYTVYCGDADAGGDDPVLMDLVRR